MVLATCGVLLVLGFEFGIGGTNVVRLTERIDETLQLQPSDELERAGRVLRSRTHGLTVSAVADGHVYGPVTGRMVRPSMA